MQQLILDALDPDLAKAFQEDPGPVALQTALQIQLLRQLKRGIHTIDVVPKPIDAMRPMPNPPGNKKGKGH